MDSAYTFLHLKDLFLLALITFEFPDHQLVYIDITLLLSMFGPLTKLGKKSYILHSMCSVSILGPARIHRIQAMLDDFQ